MENAAVPKRASLVHFDSRLFNASGMAFTLLKRRTVPILGPRLLVAFGSTSSQAILAPLILWAAKIQIRATDRQDRQPTYHSPWRPPQLFGPPAIVVRQGSKMRQIAWLEYCTCK